MTYEEQEYRRFLNRRIERGRHTGQRYEAEPANRELDDRLRPARDEARFDDITGMTREELGLYPPPVADFSNGGNTQLIPGLL
jgi:hypothetical protein